MIFLPIYVVPLSTVRKTKTSTAELGGSVGVIPFSQITEAGQVMPFPSPVTSSRKDCACPEGGGLLNVNVIAPLIVFAKYIPALRLTSDALTVTGVCPIAEATRPFFVLNVDILIPRNVGGAAVVCA